MLDFAWSLGGFLVAIGVLVAFHEYGHYWVARRCGVKVLRFSLGFGRPLWRYRARDGVEWVISAIPLGGYVKMLDEREGEVPAAERPRAFNNASVTRRIAIVSAGPVFNFVLAVFFYWLAFMIGVDGIKPVITQPAPGSAAARAGLQEKEQILSVAGETVPTWTVLRTELIDAALEGGTVQLQVLGNDGATRQVALDLAGVRVDPEVLFADLGLDSYVPPQPPRIDQVVPGSAAETAGLRSGDLLRSVNGVALPTYGALVQWVRAHPAEVANFEVERGGTTLEVRAVIGANNEAGRTVGKLGTIATTSDLWQDLRAENRLDPLAAAPAAVAQTWDMARLTLKLLWRMVLGEVSVKNVSGPIQIAQVAGYSAQIGLVYFLSFLAIVSVSLGVLNLLPVPLLDGGHLLYYAIEAVKGSPLSERAQEAGQTIGLTFLVLLMGLAFYNDIVRLLN